MDFLWKQQAERELSDMIESRHNNMQLLKNILPDHVAHHFLTADRAPEVQSFSSTCPNHINTNVALVINVDLLIGTLLAIARQGRRDVRQRAELHRVLFGRCEQGDGVHSIAQRDNWYDNYFHGNIIKSEMYKQCSS